MGDKCTECPVYNILKDTHDEKKKIIEDLKKSLQPTQKITKLQIEYSPN